MATKPTEQNPEPMQSMREVMKSAIQILVEARHTLSDPDCITRFEVACDITGRPVGPLHPAARRWSTTGALVKAAGRIDGEPIDLALAALKRAVGGNIADYHDASMRAQILQKFDVAIRILEENLAREERPD